VSKHAYIVKTSSRKHANKHTIRPQLTDSVVPKVFWVSGRTSRARSTIAYSRSGFLDHRQWFPSLRKCFLNHGQCFIDSSKFFLVSVDFLIGQPFSLSLLPSKMKLGGESSIYNPPKVGHAVSPAATCPESYRAPRRQVCQTTVWWQVVTVFTRPPHQLRL